jgi:hypothetical protein
MYESTYIINVSISSISSMYYEHINIRHHIKYTVHQNLRGNPNGRKPQNAFLYIKDYIHWKHQLPNSPATTRRRLQPPIYRLQLEGSYNSLNSLAPTPLILRLQPEGSSNSLCSPTPTRRRLRPPFLTSSYRPEI